MKSVKTGGPPPGFRTQPVREIAAGRRILTSRDLRDNLSSQQPLDKSHLPTKSTPRTWLNGGGLYRPPALVVDSPMPIPSCWGSAVGPPPAVASGEKSIWSPMTKTRDWKLSDQQNGGPPPPPPHPPKCDDKRGVSPAQSSATGASWCSSKEENLRSFLAGKSSMNGTNNGGSSTEGMTRSSTEGLSSGSGIHHSEVVDVGSLGVEDTEGGIIERKHEVPSYENGRVLHGGDNFVGNHHARVQNSFVSLTNGHGHITNKNLQTNQPLNNHCTKTNPNIPQSGSLLQSAQNMIDRARLGMHDGVSNGAIGYKNTNSWTERSHAAEHFSRAGLEKMEATHGVSYEAATSGQHHNAMSMQMFRAFADGSPPVLPVGMDYSPRLINPQPIHVSSLNQTRLQSNHVQQFQRLSLGGLHGNSTIVVPSGAPPGVELNHTSRNNLTPGHSSSMSECSAAESSINRSLRRHYNPVPVNGNGISSSVSSRSGQMSSSVGSSSEGGRVATPIGQETRHRAVERALDEAREERAVAERAAEKRALAEAERATVETRRFVNETLLANDKLDEKVTQKRGRKHARLVDRSSVTSTSDRESRETRAERARVSSSASKPGQIDRNTIEVIGLPIDIEEYEIEDWLKYNGNVLFEWIHRTPEGHVLIRVKRNDDAWAFMKKPRKFSGHQVWPIIRWAMAGRKNKGPGSSGSTGSRSTCSSSPGSVKRGHQHKSHTSMPGSPVSSSMIGTPYPLNGNRGSASNRKTRRGRRVGSQKSPSGSVKDGSASGLSSSSMQLKGILSPSNAISKHSASPTSRLSPLLDQSHYGGLLSSQRQAIPVSGAFYGSPPLIESIGSLGLARPFAQAWAA